MKLGVRKDDYDLLREEHGRLLEKLDRYERALNEIAYYDRGHPAAGQVARRALGNDRLRPIRDGGE